MQVRVWDMHDGRCVGMSKGHAGSVTALAFARKQPGKFLVSGGADKLLKVGLSVHGLGRCAELCKGCLNKCYSSAGIDPKLTL